MEGDDRRDDPLSLEPLPLSRDALADPPAELAELLARGKQAAVEHALGLGPAGDLAQVAMVLEARAWRELPVPRGPDWPGALAGILAEGGRIDGVALAGGLLLPGEGMVDSDPLVRLAATATRAALRVLVARRGGPLASALAPVRFPARRGEAWELGPWQGVRVPPADPLARLARTVCPESA